MNRSQVFSSRSNLLVALSLILTGSACSQKSAELPSTGLSDAERQAALNDGRTHLSLTVLSSKGEVSTHRITKEELTQFEERILSNDPQSVVALESEVEIGEASGDSSSKNWLPNENLLFRGKQELGLTEWETQYPLADGRGVTVGIVDDGVALNRPGLIGSSRSEVSKFAGSMNLSPLWQLPIREEGFACSELREIKTAAQSAAWIFPENLSADSLDRKVPFDFTACGLNPELPLATVQGCARWKVSLPQLKDDASEIAALAVRRKSDGKWRVLLDLDRNGQIDAAQEVFLPLSENGNSYRSLPGGTALGFDLHDGDSYPEPGVDHPAPECVRGKKPEKLITIALPHEGSLFGSHGEGVAAIAAGHRIGNRKVDGVAPGAQIFDVHFADPVGGRRYTVSEITRALLAAGKRSDVVNLSYSLFFQNPASQQAMSRMMSAVLNQTDAVYFFSAGNNGPGRGSMNRALLYPTDSIVVGAYLDPLLAQTTFGSSLPYGGVVSYSSRGPSPDGGLGAMLISPLAGMVPSTADSGFRPFSGTSSATPAMAGLSARLLSQLKAEGLPIRREWVRRALLQSSRALPGVAAVDQGWGLPWLPEALAHYRALANPAQWKPELEFRAGTQATGLPRKGVFVRGDQDRRDVFATQLAPRFPAAMKDSQERADYAETVRLEASAPWVKVPPAAFVSIGIAPVEVALDWEWLEKNPGEHLAEVRAFPLNGKEVRAILPITVLVPESNQWSARKTVNSVPAQIHRWFIEKPEGSAQHLVISRESLRSNQPLCGRFAVYDPSGAASPSSVTGVNSSSRSEMAISASEPGIYEVVWVGGNSHTACPREQNWEISWQWVDLSLEYLSKKQNDEENQVALLATTSAPFLRGKLTFSRPHTLTTVPLVLQAEAETGTWVYQGSATLPLVRGSEWEGRILSHLGRGFASRVSRLPYWTLEMGRADAGLTWLSSTSLSGKDDAFSALGLAQFARSSSSENVQLNFWLHAFENGASAENARSRLDLELKAVAPEHKDLQASARVDLVESQSSRIEVLLPLISDSSSVSAEDLIWECQFRPAGFELEVPCASVRL